MQHNWYIAGHTKQKEFLSKVTESGNIAHAYIFAGPNGVGKRSLAANFAKILLCETGKGCSVCAQCKSFAASVNPDFVELKQDEPFKIEQIRQLIYQLSLKPYQSKYKVAVIDQAESMTVEGTNALLKSLEEPKASTIIILVTSNPYRLLPTILSRAQKISFGLVPELEYEPLLPANLSSEQKQAIEIFSSGRPGIAINISKDNTFLEKLNDFKLQYQGFLNGDLVDRIKIATDLAESETVDIKEALHFWLSSLELELVKKSTIAVAGKISAVSEALGLLQANVNTKLLLTQMMLK